jgi:hypothetical protein
MSEMLTKRYEKKFIFRCSFFFILASIIIMKLALVYIDGTNSSFISVAPTESKSKNGILDIQVQMFDLNGNTISDAVTDEPFILKVTNTGSIPICYKINTEGTENNDFSHYLVLDINNLYTSTSTDPEFFYVSRDFLFPRHNVYPYVISNKKLKSGETDTWQVLYSAELTRDPVFQEHVTINSLSADLKLNLITEQVTQ